MNNRLAKRMISVMANSGIADTYAFTKRIIKSQVVILTYHRITPDRDEFLRPNALTPQEFQEQIEGFAKHYEILSLDQLTQLLYEKKQLPKKAIVITLDDGFKENYQYVYPVLKKCHVPATVFLATGYIGANRTLWTHKLRYIFQQTRKVETEMQELGMLRLQSKDDKIKARSIAAEKLKKMPDVEKEVLLEKLSNVLDVDIPDSIGDDTFLSWDEVREMNSDDIMFGAHTVNHPILTRVSLQEATLEICQSKSDIEEKTGQKVTSFAYPNGGHRDFNRQIADIIKNSGFSCAVSTIPNWITPGADLYMLGRIRVNNNQSELKLLLSGMYGDLKVYQMLQ